jgi:hypothetical protein
LKKNYRAGAAMLRHPPANSPYDCAVDMFLIVFGAIQMYRNYKRWDAVITPPWYKNAFGQKIEWTGKAYFWIGFIFAISGMWNLVFFCGWSPLSIYGPSN